MKLTFFITIIIIMLSVGQVVQAQQESNQAQQESNQAQQEPNQSNCPILRLSDRYDEPKFKCENTADTTLNNKFYLRDINVVKRDRNNPGERGRTSSRWGNSDSKSLLFFLSVQKTHPRVYKPERMRGLVAHFLRSIRIDLDDTVSLIGSTISSESKQRFREIQNRLSRYYSQLQDERRPVSQETLDDIRDYLVDNEIGLEGGRQYPESPEGYYLKKCPIAGNITPYVNWFEDNPCNRSSQKKRSQVKKEKGIR